MQHAERRANLSLAVNAVLAAGFVLLYFPLLDGAILDGWRRVVAGVALLAMVLGWLAAIIAWQAHRLGGWSQLAAFRKAIRKTGVLPTDIDDAAWRRELQLADASTRPARQSVGWAFLGAVFAVAQAIPETDLVVIAVLTVVGALVGLVLGQIVLAVGSQQRTRIALLLRALDNHSRARSS